MAMTPEDRADAEWLLAQENKQAEAQRAQLDAVLSGQEQHASVTVGMIAALKAFDTDLDLAGLAAAAGNPTSASGSETL